MKPIIKKYENKDLNIAYNNGIDEERKRILKIIKNEQNKCAEYSYEYVICKVLIQQIQGDEK